MAEKMRESGPEAPSTNVDARIIVSQPHKLEQLVETIDLIDKISERLGEDRNSDMGGGSGGTAARKRDDQPTARDIAIANLPEPMLMQQELRRHIETEIKGMRRELRQAAKQASRTGSAYQLNELYAKIRRLNGVLQQLLHASVDVIKRLYVRIFVDKQSVL